MSQCIPSLDIKKQIGTIRKELDAVIKRVIDNTDFILGKEVDYFEGEVRKYCNVRYAIGVSNGTDAIRLSLIALNIKPGEGVICPVFTYYATAGAIATVGALPVFTDIDPDTYNISVSSIEKVIREKRDFKIKAIIPVHLYGQCADMDSILKVARKYNLKVIEDAAQAFGADYLGSGNLSSKRKAGTIGDCGAVSFYPGKNLGAFGDAGIVLTNNKVIAEKINILRNQGNKQRYYHIALGFNNRMDTIQAAVLRVKLKYLDAWNKRRQEIAAYFNEQFKDLGIKTPLVPRYTTHIYHQYVLHSKLANTKIIDYLKKKGIDARIFYPLPLHLQKCFRYLRHKKGDFPEAEKAAKHIIAIPVYPDLTKEEMNYIISSLKEALYG
ncbi:MAG: DegT/DnrJ/EryC1/StrS family aminotransferase [Candidatus Omnitrophica bacterium]|nr:DegT/DnrJ/EryC1/StrS family aminotransferase [Candidatus Omnitrophota bacterium]